jgi:hypothetical protein
MGVLTTPFADLGRATQDEPNFARAANVDMMLNGFGILNTT